MSNEMLDQTFWDDHYKNNTTAWDLGAISPPLKDFFDAIEDKDIAILIPGCGNTYEASYLLDQGFTNITVIDIAPTLIKIIRNKFATNLHIEVILGDYFKHQGEYDLIVEQTFFCALPPEMRQQYVAKTHQLLKKNGMVAGLLFDRTFDGGPPFGGDKAFYQSLFEGAFEILTLETAKNSVLPRADKEVFIKFKKNSAVHATVIKVENQNLVLTDNVTTLTAGLEIINSSVNTLSNEVLIVSAEEVNLSKAFDLNGIQFKIVI